MLVDECAFGEVDETIWVVGWIAIVHEGQVRHVQSSAGKENDLLGHLPQLSMQGYTMLTG